MKKIKTTKKKNFGILFPDLEQIKLEAAQLKAYDRLVTSMNKMCTNMDNILKILNNFNERLHTIEVSILKKNT